LTPHSSLLTPHFIIMIDLHTHILPGLDDGAQTIEQSLAMAKMAVEDGINKIVATPHIFRGNYVYKDEKIGIIDETRRQLVQALEENNINLEVYSGAEVHISHNLLDEIIKHRHVLVINRGSYMFVEFPSEHVFSGVKNLFFELMSEGITPIIAHPERNSAFFRSPELLYELIQMGAFAQANSGSFYGNYGSRALEAAYQFLELRLIHFIASDCHNTKSIVPNLSQALQKAAEIIGEEDAKALVEGNPQAVLDDAELPYLPDPVNPKEKEKSFKIKIPKFFKRKD